MSELRQLQLKCLEIFDLVDKICKEHHIKYSLCGGSVVGAYLYKGFLPWDDDIDIMMTRKNYNKFLKVAKSRLPKAFPLLTFRIKIIQQHTNFALQKSSTTTQR